MNDSDDTIIRKVPLLILKIEKAVIYYDDSAILITL